MDTITRRFQGRRQTFPVYTLDEANLQGIGHVPWRESQAGQYALSDDGYVAVCLRYQVFIDRAGRSKRLFTFPYGRIWDGPHAKLSYQERKAAHNFNAASATSWQEQEARRTRTRNVVRLYAHQLVNGRLDYDLLGKAYRSDQRIPAATFRRLLRQERISRMVEEETNRILDKGGISVEQTIGHLADLLEAAKAQNAHRIVLDILTRLLVMHGALRRY